MSVDGLVYKRGTSCDTGASERVDDVSAVTSEHIERVRAIGSHVTGLLAVFAVEVSTSTGLVGVMRSTTAVILQQVAGEDIVARTLADLTHLRC